MVVDCSGWIEPLNLECLLVNNFAGSIELFLIIVILFIASVSAYFRMINTVTLVMFGLFTIIMAQYLQGLFLITVLFAGFFIAFSIGKIVKQ